MHYANVSLLIQKLTGGTRCLQPGLSDPVKTSQTHRSHQQMQAQFYMGLSIDYLPPEPDNLCSTPYRIEHRLFASRASPQATSSSELILVGREHQECIGLARLCPLLEFGHHFSCLMMRFLPHLASGSPGRVHSACRKDLLSNSDVSHPHDPENMPERATALPTGSPPRALTPRYPGKIANECYLH